MAVTTPTRFVTRCRKIGSRENPRSSMTATASSGVVVLGTATTSTRGTMIARTVVSPRPKILSIISASWVVTSVREIMVPLVEVVAVPSTTTPDEAVAVMLERGFSRLPIFRQRVTNLVGVVTAMDLLRRGASVRALEELMRQPYYVPETKRIDDLLREMQRSGVHLAVVVDEYGGSTGIVTLEDIVEQIVGDIQDAHDRAPASMERLPDGSYRVLARTEVDEINKALGWDLPKEDYETVAGLVLATLHRIPRTGEEFQVRAYTITVLEADTRRVVVVKIARTGKPEGG